MGLFNRDSRTILDKLTALQASVNTLTTLTRSVQTKETTIMSDLSNLQGEIDALTAQVANEVTVETSAVTLISGFAAQLAAAVAAATAAGATPEQLAAIHALGAQIDTSAAALAAAVTANPAG